MSWWRRFGLHLAAAVGAAGVFVAAAAVGAHQGGAMVAAPAIVRPLRSPTPATIAEQGATPAPARTTTSPPTQERSLAGAVQTVDADGFLLVTRQGRVWRIRPAPGALLRLDGKSIHGVDALQVDDRVVIFGVAETRDRFMAHAVTARRPKA